MKNIVFISSFGPCFILWYGATLFVMLALEVYTTLGARTNELLQIHFIKEGTQQNIC